MKKFYLALISISVGMLFPDDLKFSIGVFLSGMVVASIYFERDIFFGFKKEVKPDEQSDDGTDDVATK